MSYVVEQEIKGNIYLYSVDSYWDKGKKQSRQVRTYIGPKYPKNRKKSALKPKSKNIVYKKYGNMFLLHQLVIRLGIEELMKNLFPDDFNEILALAFFHLCDEATMYMFPYWLHDQYAPKMRSLYSSETSELCEKIGTDQAAVQHFFDRWINSHQPPSGIYYDITSISSYSTNIDFVEWGYNRDKENLPQINVGLVCSRENALPLFYHVYPGSISDVVTLKNCLKRLSSFGLKDIILVLDRGFCSKSNIAELNDLKDKIKFIQPMTFSMKKVVQLLKSNRRELKKIETAFKYSEEILHYVQTSLRIDEQKYEAHLYYNEKADVDLRHSFLAKILDLESHFSKKTFSTMSEYLEFRRDNIPEKLCSFFKLNRKTYQIEVNTKKVRSHLVKAGYFMFLSNAEKLDGVDMLDHYRNRDIVEKLFDVEKNHLDGKRLRAHDQYHMDGRLFIKFVALILHSHISQIMKCNKLFKRYSLRELLAELGKIRCSEMNDKFVVSEVTKSQRKILKAFEITPDMLTDHRY